MREVSYALDDLDEAYDVHDLARIRHMEVEAERYFGLSGAAAPIEVEEAEMSDKIPRRLKALGYICE